MTARHRRFALRDVTFEGVAVTGATVDTWDAEDGTAQWSARLVTRTELPAEEGELAGRTQDGQWLSGHVLIADRHSGPGGRRDVLVIFHGAGALRTVPDAGSQPPH